MFIWNDDNSMAYEETSDPRILTIVEREANPRPPGEAGDMVAPAFYVEYRYGYRLSEATPNPYSTPVEALAYARALSEWGTLSVMTERFMRAFYDTTFETVSSRMHQGSSDIVIMSTPDFREDIGLGADSTVDDSIRYSLDGERDEWQSFLDEDVYAIGYAVNMARTTEETPVILDDYVTEIECYGFYGTDCALSSARDGWHPVLDLMLDGTAVLVSN